MRYLLEVSSRALAGRDADYDRWYGEVHMGKVLALPGFEACERFSRLGMDGTPTGEFVAIYTLETDDPAATLQSLLAATPIFRMTDAIDRESVRFEFLKPIGA